MSYLTFYDVRPIMEDVFSDHFHVDHKDYYTPYIRIKWEDAQKPEQAMVEIDIADSETVEKLRRLFRLCCPSLCNRSSLGRSVDGLKS